MDQLLSLGNLTATAGQAIRRNDAGSSWEYAAMPLYVTDETNGTLTIGSTINIINNGTMSQVLVNSAGFAGQPGLFMAGNCSFVFTNSTLNAATFSNFIENFDSFTGLGLRRVSTGTGWFFRCLDKDGNPQFGVDNFGNVRISGIYAIITQASLGNWFVAGAGNLTATGANNLGIGKGALVNLGTDSFRTIIASITQSSYANELACSPVVIKNATASGTTAGQTASLNVTTLALPVTGAKLQWNADAWLQRSGTETLELAGNGCGNRSDFACRVMNLIALSDASAVIAITGTLASPPADASTVVGWVNISFGGNLFKMPLYQ
jgi:hypothetical protein